jgi:DNA-binding CsgD family transcriptional regulator
VTVSGIAGIGKTSLLDAASASAAARGWTVLRATGDELESEFAFGVVLQLLEPVVTTGPDDLFDGPASLARPLLDSRGEPLPDDSALFSVLHGVYWFLANLAEQGPVALVVDDAHWADLASLRWLHYLAKRIEEHPVALVLGTRPVPAGPTGRVLASLAAGTTVSPGRLSADGVARLVRDERPDLVLDEAGRWHDLTGGVPLFVRELIRAGDVLSSAQAAVDESLQTVRARLERLSPTARDLVAAAAVVGDGAPFWHAERVAGLGSGEPTTRRELVDAAILDDATVVRFTHPAIREAVERSVPSTTAEHLHGAAAALLLDTAAAPEVVAHHLMASPPAGSPEAVEVLERAARRARFSGDPQQSAIWLRRALTEAPAEPARTRLLADLSVAEAAAGDDAWGDTLARSIHAMASCRDRAELRLRVARSLAFRGRLEPATEVLRTALDEAEGEDLGELRLELLASLAATSRIDVSRRLHLDEELAAALAGADLDHSPAARAVLSHLTYDRALSGAPSRDIQQMGRQAVLHPAVDDDEVTDNPAAYQALLALHFADDAEGVERVLDRWFDVAARRAHETLFGLASNARCMLRLSEGLIADAVVDGQAAVETMRRERRVTLAGAAGNLALCHLERGRVDEALEVLRLPEGEGHWRSSASYTHWLYCCGVVKLASGDARGVDELREVVERQRALGAVNPATIPAPFALAQALASTCPGDAWAVFEEADAVAERFGSPRSLAAAARTRAVLEPAAAEAHLRRSESLVAHGPWGRERMQTRVALGELLLTRGDRDGARSPLRLALAEADAGGASRLADAARALLLATGARPRRAAVAGPAALTPTERSVALLAAGGSTNREIAAQRFVSVKAVEYQLANAYRKLGISARAQLAAALEAGDGT